MANEPEITVIGNLTSDPELKFTTSGAGYARFTIASTPRSYDKNTNSWVDGDAMFLQCTAWKQLGENATESLTKGMRVVVTGRLRQRRWETPEGDKRSAFGLDVEDIGPSLKWATATVNKLKRTTTDGARNVADMLGGTPIDDAQPPF